MNAAPRFGRAILAAGLLTATASCGESLAPPDQSGPTRAELSLGAAEPSGGEVFTFTTNARGGGTFVAGPAKIKFPAGSICDPRRSSYGPTEWDAPCAPLTSPITIVVRSWTDEAGRTSVSFSPNLRFVPSSSEARGVTLYLRDRHAAVSPTSRILWCGDDGNCVDESLSDPSATTRRDALNGTVFRRIKHFSAYQIADG
jgi:hypothetical protein